MQSTTSKQILRRLVKDPTLELTYAERVDRSIGKVSQKDNPLIRVQVYNRNKEPVKIGTGVVLKDGLLVTNFKLMNLIEGAGFFSVILPSDSLAGIDDMTDKDLDEETGPGVLKIRQCR